MNEEEIGNFIDAIQQQNFNSAKGHFDSLLGDKLNDSLEQEKIRVADTIFNGAEEESEEDEDLYDEDVEDTEDEDEEV